MIIRSTSGSITSKCRTRSTVDTPHASFFVEVLHYIEDTLVLGGARSSLSLYLPTLRRNMAHRLHTHTCSKTLARSTGAVTRVAGTADRKPALASSTVESLSFDLFGVRETMSCFETS